jgi:hypothetical protein
MYLSVISDTYLLISIYSKCKPVYIFVEGFTSIGEFMSRSVKHEKTQGFLDQVSKLRKHRRETREGKARMLTDIETLTGLAFIPAQEY